MHINWLWPRTLYWDANNFVHWWIRTCWKLHVTFLFEPKCSNVQNKEIEIYFNFVSFDIVKGPESICGLEHDCLQNTIWLRFIHSFPFINSIIKCVYEWLCKFSVLHFIPWHSLTEVNRNFLFISGDHSQV